MIWRTGTCVVLYSGFCGLKVITEMQCGGVYSGAVINKHWYFPKHIPSDEIVLPFRRKNIGNVDELQVTFNFPCLLS